MDDSIELLKHSEKLLTSLQERRSKSQVSFSGNNTTINQGCQYSNSTSSIDKTNYKNNQPEKSSKKHTAQNKKISFETFPIPSSEPSSNPEKTWNGDKTPNSTMSATKNPKAGILKTGSCTRFTGHVRINGQEETIPPQDDDSLSRGSAMKRSESPCRKEMVVPEILIWPDSPIEDDVAIDIEDFPQPSSPEASTSPSTPQPPPPYVRSATEPVNQYSSAKPDKEGEEKYSQKGLSQKEEKETEKEKENTTFEKSVKTDKYNVKTDGEDSVKWSLNDKPEDDDEEGVPEEKKRLLGSGQRPLRRSSVSPDSIHPPGKKPLVSIHPKETSATATESVDVTKNSASFNAEHPTTGESLNNIANQTFHDNQKIAYEEYGLGADLHFNETKKRRSFTEMLMTIPRKLSQVSEADLSNVGPMLKRGLANRLGRKHSQETTKDKKDIESDKSLKDCFFIILSGMYGLIIVVLGAVMPISETFAEMETPHLFDAFYIYLFTCSSLFILYVYTFLLRHNKKTPGLKSALNRTWSRTFVRSWSFTNKQDKENDEHNDSWYRKKITTDLGPHNPNGSFYLRLGAVGFGIGGMIHSGLLLGMHFQGIAGNSHCDLRIQAVKPLFHLIFTFSQLYFVFLNPKVCIHRYKTFARFGLMHMCGTNICVWFRNIVVETLHEMHHGSDAHHSEGHHPSDGHGSNNSSHNVSHSHGHILKENITHAPIHELSSPTSSCSWNEMMGKVLDQAAPYLYPCSIEYSLICAGIMYVLWQQVGRGPKPILVRVNNKNEDKEGSDQSQNNRMSVDCGSSSRGLFVGILLFVMAVITMVAFYVLVNKKNMTITALTLVHLSEITIYLLGMIATLAASWRMRGLAYRPGHASVLENVLILISLTGVFIFCIFGIIAAIFHEKSGLANGLSIASNLMMITQSIIQTVFMVVAAELQAFSPDDVKKKPGREFVTFLILCNLSLWGINTFETQRSEHNPIQTDFYGHMAWAILTHISVPLGIFYRFHSTVCLSNIWKNAWKNKKH